MCINILPETTGIEQNKKLIEVIATGQFLPIMQGFLFLCAHAPSPFPKSQIRKTAIFFPFKQKLNQTKLGGNRGWGTHQNCGAATGKGRKRYKEFKSHMVEMARWGATEEKGWIHPSSETGHFAGMP